jgi:hypothetical protein
VAAAAAVSRQAGFAVEDVLTSKLFTALVDVSFSNESLSGVGSDSNVGSSTLLGVLLEVISIRNLPSICHALSHVLLYPNAHAASARIAGEITALQGMHLLSLLQTSNDDAGFKAAFESFLAWLEQRVADRCVSAACANELLTMMCTQAHTMIGEGRIGAASHVISGEACIFRTYPRCRSTHASDQMPHRG